MYNYQLIKSEPYHCLPACLEIIFKEVGIPLTQKQLGKYIGINSYSKSEVELGAKVEVGLINKVLNELNLNVYFTYLRTTEYEEWMFQEKLEELLIKKSHIICTLSAGKLYGTEFLEVGHTIVIKQLKCNDIIIVDPGPNEFGLKSFSIEKIYIASRYREGGLLVLNENEL